MSIGIYKIICQDRIYIGSSIDIQKRLITHFNLLKKDKHENVKLQRAYNKYGSNNFSKSTLFYCSKKDLLFFEQKSIDVFKKYYGDLIFNLNPIAGIPPRPDQKAIEKRNKTNTGHAVSQETRDKIRQAHLGKPIKRGWKMPPGSTEKALESRKKTYERKRALGIPLISPEHQLKMQQNHPRTKWTEERRKRFSELRRGYKRTPEQRRLASERMKRKYEEHPELKYKIAQSVKQNYELHPELKAHLSEKTKQAYENNPELKQIMLERRMNTIRSNKELVYGKA